MLNELLKNKSIRSLLLNSSTNKKDYALINNSPTQKVLSYFYRHLCVASKQYNKLPKNSIHREERSVSVVEHSELMQMSSKYLPRSYLDELIKEKKCTLIHFKIGNRIFNMTFYKMDSVSKKDFDHLFKAMWMWLYIISAHPQIECVNELKLIMAFLPNKKVFTGINANGVNDEQTFDTLHVNSALTYVCQPINRMLIYRREECFKVFLHESFHCFGLDFSLHNNDKIHQELHQIFNLDSSIELAAYESYTEFWGEILNLVFNAYFISDDFHSFSLCFEGLLNVEQQFSQVQVAKILLLTGTTLVDFKNLVQKTHVFEYYIIKTMLLMNANSFFEWCIKTNPLFFKIRSNADFMCFIRTHLSKMKDMVAQGKLCVVEKLLYKEKERKEEKREQNKKKKKDEKIENKQIGQLRKTMRMSIVDLI